jgi:L-2-hydroxyglutarate oxidase
MRAEYDVAIVGAGIIGLATALSLTGRSPGLRLVVVDKEPAVARHQTGNNSGVIHSGLYYRPGSLKAQMCVTGADRMVAFCEEHAIAYTRDGKVVVATDDGQLPALEALHDRGVANGLRGIRRLGRDELGDVEPHAAGVAGLQVPTTGTVDFGEVAATMAGLLEAAGVDVVTSFEVTAIDARSSDVVLHAPQAEITATALVNCAGLHADRLASAAGVDPPVRIIPFRGEYYDVVGNSAELVRSSIYPVPDPSLPFLGVHLTRTVGGKVHAGPNAVLAGAREGYRWGTVRPGELWESISYPGLARLAGRHWRAGIAEVARSASRGRFTRSVQELVPAIAAEDLRKDGAGVRAQAVTRSGDLYDDFLIVESRRALHVLNAPSPGATSSLAIGDHLADQIIESLGREE